jgi:hypothetical protein
MTLAGTTVLIQGKQSSVFHRIRSWAHIALHMKARWSTPVVLKTR